MNFSGIQGAANKPFQDNKYQYYLLRPPPHQTIRFHTNVLFLLILFLKIPYNLCLLSIQFIIGNDVIIITIAIDI